MLTVGAIQQALVAPAAAGSVAVEGASLRAVGRAGLVERGRVGGQREAAPSGSIVFAGAQADAAEQGAVTTRSTRGAERGELRVAVSVSGATSRQGTTSNNTRDGPLVHDTVTSSPGASCLLLGSIHTRVLQELSSVLV